MEKSKNIVSTSFVRPRLIDPSEFLGKFPLEDRVNKIGELIDVGTFITACTPDHSIRRGVHSDPLYYHEVRKLYIKWKVQCREFFKWDLKFFRDEYEIFSESDQVPLSVFIEENDEVYNSTSNGILRDIATEVRSKLPTLRDARIKINNSSLLISTHNLYIEKVGDDFKYKGKLLPLSKRADYYRVFCALFALLPEGGEVEYKKLIGEIKSRIPKTKLKSKEKMLAFIHRNLTAKGNGFRRYSKTPNTEDNSKPLIEPNRGVGIRFNNKAG